MKQGAGSGDRDNRDKLPMEAHSTVGLAVELDNAGATRLTLLRVSGSIRGAPEAASITGMSAPYSDAD